MVSTGIIIQTEDNQLSTGLCLLPMKELMYNTEKIGISSTKSGWSGVKGFESLVISIFVPEELTSTCICSHFTTFTSHLWPKHKSQLFF